MPTRKGSPADSVLDPTSSDALRRAVVRLRAGGLTGTEAAAEIVRAGVYAFLDAEAEASTGSCPRLRIVKR